MLHRPPVAALTNKPLIEQGRSQVVKCSRAFNTEFRLPRFAIPFFQRQPCRACVIQESVEGPLVGVERGSPGFSDRAETASSLTTLTLIGSPSSSIPNSWISDLNENRNPSGISFALLTVAVLTMSPDISAFMSTSPRIALEPRAPFCTSLPVCPMMDMCVLVEFLTR